MHKTLRDQQTRVRPAFAVTAFANQPRAREKAKTTGSPATLKAKPCLPD